VQYVHSKALFLNSFRKKLMALIIHRKASKIILILCVLAVGSISAQDSLITVTAEKGDGILSLLRKQGVNPYERYDDFIAMNMDNLRDSVHLYEGRTYRIPSIATDSVVVVDSLQQQAEEIK